MAKSGKVLYPDGVLTDKDRWIEIFNDSISPESIERRRYVTQENNPMIVSVEIDTDYESNDKDGKFFNFLFLRGRRSSEMILV